METPGPKVPTIALLLEASKETNKEQNRYTHVLFACCFGNIGSGPGCATKPHEISESPEAHLSSSGHPQMADLRQARGWTAQALVIDHYEPSFAGFPREPAPLLRHHL